MRGGSGADGSVTPPVLGLGEDDDAVKLGEARTVAQWCARLRPAAEARGD